MATNIATTEPTPVSTTIASLIEAIIMERCAVQQGELLQQIQYLSGGYGGLITKVKEFEKKLEIRDSHVHDDVLAKFQEFFKDTLQMVPVENKQ